MTWTFLWRITSQEEIFNCLFSSCTGSINCLNLCESCCPAHWSPSLCERVEFWESTSDSGAAATSVKNVLTKANDSVFEQL